MQTRNWLSLLWVMVMLNMAYADILSLYVPGIHEELAAFAGEVPISLLMLFGAIKIQIPIGMILLSRVLGYSACRRANIVAAVLTIVFVVGGGSLMPHYVFIAALEVVLMLWIIRIAWRWRDEGQNRALGADGAA